MSRQIAADLSARSSLKKSEAIAAIKARASLIADFKNGEYKLYTPETGLARTDFASIFNFTRASVASVDTYAGVADIASGQPRFSAGKGLRTEESRENLLTYSEEFDNADWSKRQVTVTTNTTIAPDGSATADKIVQDSTAGSRHNIEQQFPHTAASSYTISFFAKAAENTLLQVSTGSSFSGDWANINIEKGIVVDGTVVPDIEAYPNGWFRVSYTVVANASGTNPIAFDIIEDPNTTRGGASFTGDGSSGLYIWGAQLEEGSFPTTYIPTAASSVVRDQDNCSHTLGAEFNAVEGTIPTVAKFGDNTSDNDFVGVISLATDGAVRPALALHHNARAGDVRLTLYGDPTGGGFIEHTGTDFNYGDLVKMACSYNTTTGDVTIAVNGNIVTGNFVDLADIKSVNRLLIGQLRDIREAFALNNTIEDAYIFPEALTADELKTLTEPDL